MRVARAGSNWHLGPPSRYPYALFPLEPVEIQRSTAVASTCDICGKGPSFGNNVSHSQVKTRRRWNPNIQRVRTLVGGTAKRQNVCTSCLKAGKVTR
jgi:large subunit ribosomal protein L28